ncbi:hypothetical protein B296_00036859 [Ensete ventricosum]|uniref:Uncharacterized protein n=1 Tax=Ensete ventricosum TaxID=4639 RepID=A0A426YUA0_ENSVE|nr:hypothetical protein B296_00036859 [Ensete ventricosum]
MFLLPARVILRPRVMDSTGEEQRNSRDFLSLFFFSLFFFLPPSAVTARNWPPAIEIDHYLSISSGNGAETAPIDGTTR